MIQTIIYNHKNFPIPSNQIFEKVLNLTECLSGQSIKIKSIFNAADKDPSMVIFYQETDGIYRFKDFSSGNYGDAIDIVMHLHNIDSRQEGYRKALELFKDNNFVQPEIIAENKEIANFVIRKWNNNDAQYWKDYCIGGTFLKAYNIKPLASYNLNITRGDVTKEFTFKNPHMYGYFKKNGELYKIYQPNKPKSKFLKVQEYIQGSEQLTKKKLCLIIASSLKDIGAFYAMQIPNIELIAPDSENVTIITSQLELYKSQYKYIFTMFDNDNAGIKAMNLYQESHAIPYIHFDIEKDFALSILEHGIASCKTIFKQKFKIAINDQDNRSHTSK